MYKAEALLKGCECCNCGCSVTNVDIRPTCVPVPFCRKTHCMEQYSRPCLVKQCCATRGSRIDFQRPNVRSRNVCNLFQNDVKCIIYTGYLLTRTSSNDALTLFKI